MLHRQEQRMYCKPPCVYTFFLNHTHVCRVEKSISKYERESLKT